LQFTAYRASEKEKRALVLQIVAGFSLREYELEDRLPLNTHPGSQVLSKNGIFLS
jgi:hypothetical protein